VEWSRHPALSNPHPLAEELTDQGRSAQRANVRRAQVACSSLLYHTFVEYSTADSRVNTKQSKSLETRPKLSAPPTTTDVSAPKPYVDVALCERSGPDSNSGLIPR